MRRVLPLLLLFACDEPARRRDEAVALGASYPEGAKGVGILVEMLDDDDASVREAAAKSLVALGRKGLADLSRYLNDPKEPSREAFLERGDLLARVGGALTPADLAYGMAMWQTPESRRGGAASAVVAGCWGGSGTDPMIDILTATWGDADMGVRTMASASLAILGWSTVSGQHPATAEEVKGLLPLVVDPGDEASWTSCVATGAIVVLRPRSEWPEHALKYSCAYEEKEPAADNTAMAHLDEIRERVRAFEESATGKPGEFSRQMELRSFLHQLRAQKAVAAALTLDLERLLAKEQGFERVDVLKTLAVVPEATETVARRLGEVLRTSHDWIGAEALAVLVAMGPAARPAVPALIEVLAWSEDEDGPGVDLAQDWAGMGPSAQPALRSKRAAASLLGHLGAKQARPALAALGSHEDARLRYRAATALRRIGTG